MESIDVHDLPEEHAQLVQDFVEFLRRKLRTGAFQNEEAAKERDWGAVALSSFAKDWDNEHDAIYDDWKEHYHVPER